MKQACNKNKKRAKGQARTKGKRVTKKKSRTSLAKERKIKEARKKLVKSLKVLKYERLKLKKAREELKQFQLKMKNSKKKKQLGSKSEELVFTGFDGEARNVPIRRNRRELQTVFAEQFDPDEDNSDRVVHPKTDNQRKQLLQAVRKVLAFRNLEQGQIQEIIDAMFIKRVVKGEAIIKQGDDGDYFYVIEIGIFNAYVKLDGKQKKVKSYANEGSFGELALMHNLPRAATIKAGSDGVLWALDRQTFRRIVMNNAYHQQQHYTELLAKVPMLKNLKNDEILKVGEALQPREFRDEIIFRQNDQADGMYFIESGMVKITSFDQRSKTEKELAQLTSGQYFGELALITKNLRAATAHAEGNTKVAFLDVGAFERLLGPCMDIMKREISSYEKRKMSIFGSK